MIRTTLALGLLLAFIAVASADDETQYKIQFDPEQVGFKSQVSRKATSLMRLTQIVKGTTKVNEIRTNTEESFTEEILERASSETPPTKLTRTYIKSRHKINDQLKPRSYEGKSLLLERKGNKYSFTVNGRDLPREESLEFDRRFNRDRPSSLDLIRPGKAVKVNEVWNVPIDLVSKMLAEQLEIDPAQSQATGKLMKTYVLDGKPFGVVQVEMDLAVSKLKLGSNWLPISEKGKAKVKIQADVCIDGSLPDGALKSSTDMALSVEVPAGTVQVLIQSTEEVTGKAIQNP